MPGPESTPRFIAIARGGEDDEAARLAVVVSIQRRLPQTTRIDLARFTLLVTTDENALPVDRNADDTLLLLGEIFERGASGTAPSRPASIEAWPGDRAETLAHRLVTEQWGRYAAFFVTKAGRPRFMRDPSGAVPAMLIEGAQACTVSDVAPRWLHELAQGPPRIDWDNVAAQLCDPTTVTHRSLLEDARTAVPGRLVAIGGRADDLTIWDPAAIAARAGASTMDAERLRFTVMDATRALAGPAPLLLELSGGLDSSILLACLAPSRTPLCVNLATGFPGGDERGFAREAADKADAHLVEVLLDPGEMALDALAGQSGHAEPLLYGSDVTHERVMSGLAQAYGAGTIMTGQGGDAIFFQEPTPLVAADLLMTAGWTRGTMSALIDAAHRSHSSIWSALSAIRQARRAPRLATTVEHDLALLGPRARHSSLPALHHPWIDGFRRLPPAKALQLQAIATSQLFNGPTARGKEFRLVHPLLSQPVVELCLAIPTWRLAYGRLDRALARAAFAPNLPPSIARRRGKAEAAAYYSRALVANLAFLRPLLLDGLLVSEKLLDAEMLEQALDERSLMHRPDHRVLIAYASLECWLRSWS